MTVNLADIGLQGTVKVRDLRARQDRGTATGSYTTTVPAHGTAFLKLRGETVVPGTDLGGSTSASPALVRFDDDNAAVFARDTDGVLRQKSMVDGRWGGWTSLGGPARGKILGQPAAFASSGRIDLFVRGTDNAAYHRTFTHNRWGAWQRLGGTLTDSPSVAFTGPDDWTLFARGADGRVWTRDQETGWTSIGAPGDTPIYGRPGAATISSGTLVAVRTPDDSVWYRRKTGGNWSDWVSLGGVISGSPTLVASADRVYLFARAGDYTLWQLNFVDGAWGGWFKRNEFASNSLVGAVGAAQGANGSAWLAVRGPDNAVHQAVL
jgi:alpha-galactosidase